MKVLFLSKRYYMGKDLALDHYGRFHELPAALERAGVQVERACLSYHPERDRPADRPAQTDWRCYSSGHLFLPGLYRYQRALSALTASCRPDVIIGASDAVHVILAAALGREHGLPVIADLYDNFEAYPMTRVYPIPWLYHRALRRANAVAVISEELAGLLRRTVRPAGEIAVIGNAIPENFSTDLDRIAARERFSLPSHLHLFGTAGALTASRGIADLYQAFLQLASEREDVSLVLAGPFDKELPPPQHERVIYLGELDYAQIPALYRALDVGVICNRPGAFGDYCYPQKYHEMIAIGLPPVAAATGVLARRLACYPGLLYQPGDIQGLVSALTAQLTQAVLPEQAAPGWSERGVQLLDLIRHVTAVA